MGRQHPRDGLTSERREAIIRLLVTRDDNLPSEPRGQWSTFGAETGEKATRSVQCRGKCEGTGKVTTRKGVEKCPDCGGRGRVKVDAVTGRSDAEIRSPAQAMTSAQREDWRRSVDGKLSQLRAELAGESDVTQYGWERERERMYERFDYAALDAALEHLRQVDPAACSLLHSVYVYRETLEPSTSVEAIVERGLWFLHYRLPDPLRAPGASKPAALQRREKKFERRDAA